MSCLILEQGFSSKKIKTQIDFDEKWLYNCAEIYNGQHCTVTLRKTVQHWELAGHEAGMWDWTILELSLAHLAPALCWLEEPGAGVMLQLLRISHTSLDQSLVTVSVRLASGQGGGDCHHWGPCIILRWPLEINKQYIKLGGNVDSLPLQKEVWSSPEYSSKEKSIIWVLKL